jgi:hypothetical protein
LRCVGNPYFPPLCFHQHPAILKYSGINHVVRIFRWRFPCWRKSDVSIDQRLVRNTICFPGIPRSPGGVGRLSASFHAGQPNGRKSELEPFYDKCRFAHRALSNDFDRRLLAKTQKYRERLNGRESGNAVSDSWQKMGWVLFKKDELKALKEALHVKLTSVSLLIDTAQW